MSLDPQLKNQEVIFQEERKNMEERQYKTNGSWRK